MIHCYDAAIFSVLQMQRLREIECKHITIDMTYVNCSCVLFRDERERASLWRISKFIVLKGISKVKVHLSPKAVVILNSKSIGS